MEHLEKVRPSRGYCICDVLSMGTAHEVPTWHGLIGSNNQRIRVMCGKVGVLIETKSSGHVIPRFWGWERDGGCCYSTSVGSKWSTSLQAVLISFPEEVVFSWFWFCLTSQNDVQHAVTHKVTTRAWRFHMSKGCPLIQTEHFYEISIKIF